MLTQFRRALMLTSALGVPALLAAQRPAGPGRRAEAHLRQMTPTVR